MKLKIENEQIKINRKQMLDIRRMDHNQLGGFMSGIYQEGAKEGAKEAALKGRCDVLKTRQQAWEAFVCAVNQAKGIGETRKKELQKVFKEEFGKEIQNG